jgi:hypothetical protein
VLTWIGNVIYPSLEYKEAADAAPFSWRWLRMERALSLLATATRTTATLTAALATAFTAALATAFAATRAAPAGRGVPLHLATSDRRSIPLYLAAADRRSILLHLAARMDFSTASRFRYRRAAANGGPTLVVPARAFFDRSAISCAVTETPLGRSVAPALPTIFAAPAKVLPPGIAAAVPAGTVPAIEIEAIAVAFDDEDRDLLCRVGGIESWFQSGADVDRHGVAATRAYRQRRNRRTDIE